ncbi:MAG: hypothetical protein V2I82_00195 [Halieaceae bacterium]|jgi:hypothetical protein|nr:hypothetical protein [Halieaceae bacterium]
MQQRDTFIAYGDLLRELATQCRRSEGYLRERQGPDLSNVDQLAEWVARRQGRLATGLSRCADQGPRKLVERRLQYKPHYRAWNEPGDRRAALESVVALNRIVTEVLDEEADKSVAIEIGEQMADLTAQIDAVNRKISLALVTSQDL